MSLFSLCFSYSVGRCALRLSNCASAPVNNTTGWPVGLNQALWNLKKKNGHSHIHCWRYRLQLKRKGDSGQSFLWHQCNLNRQEMLQVMADWLEYLSIFICIIYLWNTLPVRNSTPQYSSHTARKVEMSSFVQGGQLRFYTKIKQIKIRIIIKRDGCAFMCNTHWTLMVYNHSSCMTESSNDKGKHTGLGIFQFTVPPN